MSDSVVNYSDYTLVIPYHSAYQDVCDNFLRLLERNWPDCPFHIVLAIHSQPVQVEGYTSLFCGENTTMMGCLSQVIKKYTTPYYLVFLPDAFINRPVIQREVDSFLQEVSALRPAYCRLLTSRVNTHPKPAGDYIRYIHSQDRYIHSFIAFLASGQFLLDEIKSCPSDLRFEEKYLQLANDFSVSYHFPDRFVLTKDIFHIVHGIVKGKWNRMALYSLQKNNPETIVTQRAKLSLLRSVYQTIYPWFLPKMPYRLRWAVKNFITKFRPKVFVTKE